MANQNINTQLHYKIEKIHTTTFSCRDIDEEYIDELFDGNDKLTLNITNDLSFNKDKSLLIIDVVTELFRKSGQSANDSPSLLNHTGRTTFKIKELGDFYHKPTDSYKLPSELMKQLYLLAYTHARALLASETSPTSFKDKFFLPVLPVDDFVKKPKSVKN